MDLAEIVLILAASSDPKAVAREIAEHLRTTLNARSSAVFRLDQDSGDLVALAVSGELALVVGRAALAVERARLYREAEAGRRAADERTERLKALSVLSQLVTGASGVSEVFADQAAVAIENAHLYGEVTGTRDFLKSRARQQAVVARLGQRALAGLDVSTLMDEAVDLVAKDLDVEYCKILELLPDGRGLLLRAGVGWQDGLVGSAVVEAGGNSEAGFILSSGRPAIIEDLATDARFNGTGLLHAHGVVSGASVIIPGQLGPFGVLGAHTTRRRAFSPDDVHFLEAVANVLATAIERKQAEEVLRHSQKMEAVGRLAGGVAHDFNNLLTVITGRGQLLLARLHPADPVYRDVELIHKTAQRAAGLTHQLLAFSRKQVLQPRVVDLNALVGGMGTMLRRLIGEDIELVMELTPGVWPVKTDPGQIEQVVLNLVVNARDAMPGGGTLTLGTANAGPDGAFVLRHPGATVGAHVVLTVRDTGCGMDAETQAHIFEPFFTTKRVGGTGLGLSIVYGIVKQHQGHIGVESAVGEGTQFRIYLPRAPEEPEPVEEGRAAVATPSGTETVLVVEDEAEVRALTCEVLEAKGYHVLEAADGRAALEVCRRHGGPIHLLLTDVVMPRMSGRELADQVAAVRPETRVLYVSGYTDDALGHRGVLDPGVVLLQKPFTPARLVERVREVLDSQGRPAVT
jgi:signal transduction histidine kinase